MVHSKSRGCDGWFLCRGYVDAPMKKQGAIILGIGGDNSDGAVGTFYVRCRNPSFVLLGLVNSHLCCCAGRLHDAWVCERSDRRGSAGERCCRRVRESVTQTGRVRSQPVARRRARSPYIGMPRNSAPFSTSPSPTAPGDRDSVCHFPKLYWAAVQPWVAASWQLPWEPS